MMLEIHAHIREREREIQQQEQARVDHLLATGGNMTDAAALDAAKDVLAEGGSIEDMLAAAVRGHAAATKQSAVAKDNSIEEKTFPFGEKDE